MNQISPRQSCIAAALAALAIATAAGNANALAIRATAGSTNSAAGPSSNSDGESNVAASGVVTANASAPGDNVISGSAAQVDTGDSAVAAGGFGANGIGSPNTTLADATTSFSETYTNSSAGTRLYSLDFSLSEIRLRFQDFFGGSNSGEHMHASYLVDILLDGGSIFSSAAELSGGRVDHTLTESGTDLGGVADGLGTGEFGYTFAPSSFSLGLGSYDAGESFTLEAILGVHVDFPGFEAGAIATVGDPNGLTRAPGLSLEVSSVPTGAVPAPGTWFLLGAGLFGLGWRALRLV